MLTTKNKTIIATALGVVALGSSVGLLNIAHATKIQNEEVLSNKTATLAVGTKQYHEQFKLRTDGLCNEPNTYENVILDQNGAELTIPRDNSLMRELSFSNNKPSECNLPVKMKDVGYSKGTPVDISSKSDPENVKNIKHATMTSICVDQKPVYPRTPKVGEKASMRLGNKTVKFVVVSNDKGNLTLEQTNEAIGSKPVQLELTMLPQGNGWYDQLSLDK